MKNVLVAVAAYPDNDGSVKLMYVHTRNLFYVHNDIDVTVLNFSAKEDYIYEGIQVITENSYRKSTNRYDLLILHAANIRNHYLFLKKYGNNFPKYLFFFHGHEVLRNNDAYSKPYDFDKPNLFKNIIQDVYDSFKLRKWRKFFEKDCKSYLIFVSHWMYEMFLKYTNISPSTIDGKYSITYNNVGEIFERETFDENINKEYDFITIRSNLDISKYSIDIVNRLAMNTPKMKFLIIGKGEFFNHYKKAENITWLDCTLSHKEIIEYLQKSRYALMPTRTDAQGLMMCEMAAFGIPVITSDISVCHEVFDGFDNVYFISNDDINMDLYVYENMISKCEKDCRYFQATTVIREVNTINQICN